MKTLSFFVTLSVVVFTSCLGVSADITIKADGSGKMALEYRVSQTLESLGRLDGNESRPTIPVGRVDFERSLARIPGISLSKYSSKNIRNASGGSDLVTSAVLDFKDSGALMGFLDNAGSHTALVQEGTGSLLRLNILAPSKGVVNPDLLSFLKEISGGYDFSVSFTLPKNAGIKTIPESVPAAKLASNGKKVSFSIGMDDLLTLKDGLTLEICW